MEEIIVYIDGSSLGNPGPAGVGIYFEKGPKNILKKAFSKSVGKKTNNQAEYLAAIFALEKIKQIFGKKASKNLKIKIFSDSELLVKQMTNFYKIKEKDLIDFFIKLHNLSLDFKKVEFNLIKREENKIADKLSKESAKKIK